MLVQPTTLEELGWKPYWDAAGRNPVLPGDLFDVKPGGSVEICYMQKAKQEEDGKWYSNDVYMYEPLPGIIGGVYNKSRMYTEGTVGGTGIALDTIKGKIEEIAYWGKALDKASLVNYQGNLSGMIGNGVEFMYQTEQEATDNKLYQYYLFNSTVPVVPNFTNNSGVSIKNGDFTIGAGKHSNAVNFDGYNDFIKLDNMMSERDFTMNIRFYIEEMKDFTLFENKNIMKISFDESIGKFILAMYPYIGNEYIAYIEIPNLKVHHWYDFGITYGNGKVDIIVDTADIESFSPNIGIGGVEKLKLNMSNIASVSVSGLRYGTTATVVSVTNFAITSEDADNQSKNMIESFISGKVYDFDSGAENIMDLLHDRDNSENAFIAYQNGSATILDEVSDRRKLTISRTVTAAFAYSYYRKIESTLSIEETEDDTVRFTYLPLKRIDEYRYNYYATWKRNPILYNNKLLGNQVIKLRIVFKDEIMDTSNIFPMLTMFPGTRVKVVHRERIPDEMDIVKFLKDNGKWGRYWKHPSSTSSYYLTSYPAVHNTTGKTIILRGENSTEYVYVGNNSVAYYSGGAWHTTSYNEENSHVYPDNNWPFPFKETSATFEQGG